VSALGRVGVGCGLPGADLLDAGQVESGGQQGGDLVDPLDVATAVAPDAARRSLRFKEPSVLIDP